MESSKEQILFKLIGVFVLMFTFVIIDKANAVVLTFDDLPLQTQVDEGYASFGVYFSRTDSGTRRGLTNGDPGNWGLEGTNGSNFLGFNGNPSYRMTLTFDQLISDFSLDVSGANGSFFGDEFTISSFKMGDFVETHTITLGGISDWKMVSLATNGIDQITWFGTGETLGTNAPDHAYGVDNIQFSNNFTPPIPDPPNPIPEPSTMLLLGSGLVGLIGYRWKKSHA